MDSGYVGPVGIDSIVARDSLTTELKVVPVIEVNVRYTMGRVAHAIEAALRKKGNILPATLIFHSKQELKRKNLKNFTELASKFSIGSFFSITPVEEAISTWVAVHFN